MRHFAHKSNDRSVTVSHMSRVVKFLLLGLPLLTQLAVAQTPQAIPLSHITNSTTKATRAREPIRPIPQTLHLNSAKVLLGKRLFSDPQLSADQTIACSSCHSLSKGGTDREPRSTGINHALGQVNAPTVFNSALNFKQFWDGRAETLEEQVDGPTQAPTEMGAKWDDVIVRLSQSDEYVSSFKSLYPDGVQRKNVKDAIAEFERSLITPNARFDRWLRGDDGAISDEEKRGYQNFKAYGCISCHQGVNVGGKMFQPLGIMGDYFQDRGSVTPADFGRFNVTGKEEDRFTFKVPSLRNVALTAPYFHDASAKTLEDAVTIMAKYQLGRELPEEDRTSIVAFLKSLTGEYNGVPLK